MGFNMQYAFVQTDRFYVLGNKIRSAIRPATFYSVKLPGYCFGIACWQMLVNHLADKLIYGFEAMIGIFEHICQFYSKPLRLPIIMQIQALKIVFESINPI